MHPRDRLLGVGLVVLGAAVAVVATVGPLLLFGRVPARPVRPAPSTSTPGPAVN